MLGQVGQIAVYIADNVMVGKLGATNLAAISLGIAIMAIPTVVGIGIALALPPLVSKSMGEGNKENTSIYFKHSLLLNTAIGVLSCLVILSIIPFLCHMGQDPEIIPLTQKYMTVSAYAMIPLMIFNAFRGYSDGMGETIPPMIAMIAGNIVNVVFNYILIYGKLGFDGYGIQGAAWASFIARCSMIGIILILLYKWKDLFQYLSEKLENGYEWSVFKKLLSLGIPTSLQMFFEISAFSGAAFIMGLVGKNEQAAHQIAISLSSITFLICTGLAFSSTIRVGNEYGKKNIASMKDVGISSIIQVVVLMAICSLLFYLFRHALPYIYIDDPIVIGIATSLLIFAAIFQIPDGVQVTVLASLRGAQDVKIPTLITFVSYYFFGIPVSYLAAITFGLGAKGVWLGLLVGLFVSACLLIWRFLYLIDDMDPKRK